MLRTKQNVSKTRVPPPSPTPRVRCVGGRDEKQILCAHIIIVIVIYTQIRVPRKGYSTKSTYRFGRKQQKVNIIISSEKRRLYASNIKHYTTTTTNVQYDDNCVRAPPIGFRGRKECNTTRTMRFFVSDFYFPARVKVDTLLYTR